MPKREWYVSWFNTQEYLDLYRHRDEEDAKKIISLILRNISLNKKANVLDLACGTGRHSLLLARKGFNVTGIDLSKYLITQAKEKLRNEYKKYIKLLKFEIRDMREFSYPGHFDLVVNIFTSFGYFEKDKDNERVIKCISDSLKINGFFVIDFLNKNYIVKNLLPYSIKKKRNKVIIQIRKITNNFVEQDILILKKHNSFYNLEKYRERIKLYTLANFRKMFGKYKLKIVKIFGSYYGGAYEKYKSPRLIIIAKRA